MNHSILALTLLVALGSSAPAGAMRFGNKINLNPKTCEQLADVTSAGEALKRSDVIVIDHEKGQVVWPAPARLVVPDRGVFVIVVKNTDPTNFNYSVDLIDEAGAAADVDLTASGEAIQAQQINAICLSWRHLEAFPLYRIKITGRAVATRDAQARAVERLSQTGLNLGLANEVSRRIFLNMPRNQVQAFVEHEDSTLTDQERKSIFEAIEDVQNLGPQDGKLPFLYPYTFPVWVQTAGPQLGFSTGLGFSDLADQRYFVKTAEGGAKTVERDRSAEDDFRPDLMAFATLSFGLGRVRPGIAAGLGLSGNDGNPRYFVGPSLVLGERLMLSAGVFGAKVDRLPKGQSLGRAPLNTDIAAKLEALDKRFKTGIGISISWFLGKGKPEFIGGLGGQTTPAATKPPTQPAPAPPAPVQP